MSRFDELARRMQLRPITRWPGDMTPDSLRRPSPFQSEWIKTRKLLDHELECVGAEAIVLGIAMEDADLRLDGTPRARAVLTHPGVLLSFNPDGVARDRLEFATDRFSAWEDNLRAISLGLEALRKVDRYGITSGTQQYAGFRAITAGDDGSMGLYSKTQALEYLDEKWDGDLKAALKATHPDRGGDPDELRRVLRAKALIG